MKIIWNVDGCMKPDNVFEIDDEKLKDMSEDEINNYIDGLVDELVEEKFRNIISYHWNIINKDL